MTTIPSITPLPTPVPTTADPTTFDTRADAFLGALPGLVTEENASIAAMNTVASEVTASAGASAASAAASAVSASASAASAALSASSSAYFATSSSSVAVGTGAKSFGSLPASRAFQNSDEVVIWRRGDFSTRMYATVDVSGYNSGANTLAVTVTSAVGSGTYTDWLIAERSLVPTEVLGKHAIWVPAVAMIPRLTNGAGLGVTETATNKVMRRSLDFDSATVEYAQFALRMPKSWDEGTVSAAFAWSHPATNTNFGVQWALRAVAISDGDAEDAALGSGQVSTDTGGTTDRLYLSPETSAITIAGTPQVEDLVIFEVFRNVTDAADTMAVDARLRGVTLYITTNAGTDA